VNFGTSFLKAAFLSTSCAVAVFSAHCGILLQQQVDGEAAAIEQALL
jgi:hypothetical protein